MRQFVLFVLFASLLIPAGSASGEPFADKGTGLRVNVPSGWSILPDHAEGQTKFVASYQVEGSKFVQFVAQVGTADNYNADAWLKQQKKAKAKLFQEVTNELTVDKDRRIGGGPAVGYSMSGKRNDAALRVRVYHVVRGRFFFQFTESSFNGAHEGDASAAIDKIWDAISFGDAETEVSAPPADGKPRVIEDEKGNYKLTVPAGWETINPAPPDDKSQQRVIVSRPDDSGNAALTIIFWRIESGNAASFSDDAPGDVVDRAVKNWKLFASIYGNNSEDRLAPEVDDSIALGGVDKAAEFKMSSRTMKEIADTIAAEKLKARGDKSVEVPKYPPTVCRGRVAMISPHFYVVIAVFAPGAGDNPQLVKEYNAVMESVEFLNSSAKPPALRMLKQVGDTLTDPANAKARKMKTGFVLTGRKPYKIELKYTVPKGFVVLEKKLGGNNSIAVYAQDGNNNWVKIVFLHLSHKEAGDKNAKLVEKKVRYATWKSEWESKARGSKVPAKPVGVRLGKLSGKGYKKLKGEVDGWPATFDGLIFEKSGWRTIVRMDTTGDLTALAPGIKDFLKSVKINYKAK